MAGRDFRARFEDIRVRLSQEAGKIQKRVNDGLEQEAKNIQADAIALAPFKEGYLEKSIKLEAKDRRTAFVIYIDKDAPAAGREGGPTTVGEGPPRGPVGGYAVFLHEAPDDDINWGPGTLAKPGTKGMRPGSKYLERAYKNAIRGFASRMRNIAQGKDPT